MKLSTEELEEKVTSTVQTIVEVAVELGSSLGSIEKNTRALFWWTSWAIGIVLGLFILHLLVKVSAQLAMLNTYQAVFQRMWDEDRERDDEERRYRRKAMKRAAAQRVHSPFDSESPFNEAYGAPPGDMMDQLRGVVERAGPIPQAGTAEHDEMIRRLREELQLRAQ
ncbi:hypothetical protein F5Y01DRAFT_326090 [Xylaria sp. FL0043]|nr:hypothetical protein F5Y01DRAFT_326090 [Xylaria sp. FL0043]